MGILSFCHLPSISCTPLALPMLTIVLYQEKIALVHFIALLVPFNHNLHTWPSWQMKVGGISSPFHSIHCFWFAIWVVDLSIYEHLLFQHSFTDSTKPYIFLVPMLASLKPIISKYVGQTSIFCVQIGAQ